jgi:hypothetical protein
MTTRNLIAAKNIARFAAGLGHDIEATVQGIATTYGLPYVEAHQIVHDAYVERRRLNAVDEAAFDEAARASEQTTTVMSASDRRWAEEG